MTTPLIPGGHRAPSDSRGSDDPTPRGRVVRGCGHTRRRDHWRFCGRRWSVLRGWGVGRRYAGSGGGGRWGSGC